MAIDMTTVKAISYNNKDVVKIEDSQGHILWQSSTPTPTDEPIFVSAPGIQQKLENNTFSRQTWTGLTNFNGNRIWSDGTDIYCQSSTFTSALYTLNLTTNDWTSFTSNVNIDGNQVWSDYDGNVYFSNGRSSSQYIWNKTTKTWSAITWTLGSGTTDIQGNRVIKAKNKIFYIYDRALCEIDTQNRTVTYCAKLSTGIDAGFNMWTDGTTYYYDGGYDNMSYIIDLDNYTSVQNTWYINGTTTKLNFQGCRVIKYNNKIIAQINNNFYELDVLTKTGSPYTFARDGVNIASNVMDRAWNAKGRWSGGVQLIAVATK